MSATKEQINAALSREIKAAYIREGITAAQLAQKVGFSIGTMTRLLGGGDIPVSRLYLIADALNTNPIALVQAAVEKAEREAE